MSCIITRHALLALVCLVQLANCDSGVEWQRLETQQCVNESLAVQVTESRGETECLTKLDETSGLLIAQFNSETRQCSVFHYQSVCHLIDAAASSAHHTQHSCTVYASHKTIKFMNLSNKLNETLSTKFQGVWVMSDDEDASKSNLVCNGQTQQWQAVNVTFTSEGVKFDGTSSKMTLENVNFGDLSLGLTWLLRLKRISAVQSFLENFACDTKVVGGNFIEYNSNNKLSFGTASQFSPTKLVTTNSAIMTSDAEKFVNIGITAIPSAENYRLFYNGSFVTDVTEESNDWNSKQSEYSCFSLGHRVGVSKIIDGTVKAVAVANHFMSEDEIREFFDTNF